MGLLERALNIISAELIDKSEVSIGFEEDAYIIGEEEKEAAIKHDVEEITAEEIMLATFLAKGDFSSISDKEALFVVLEKAVTEESALTKAPARKGSDADDYTDAFAESAEDAEKDFQMSL